MLKLPLLFNLIFVLFASYSTIASDKNYTSEKIIIQKVKGNVYQHISFLQSETFGRVSCNGMIVFDKNEAIVFDTPIDDSTSAELIKWIKDSLHCKIIAIIPTHFHEDCVGGLKEFHRQGIPSYANKPTIKSAEERGFPVPQKGFDKSLK